MIHASPVDNSSSDEELSEPSTSQSSDSIGGCPPASESEDRKPVSKNNRAVVKSISAWWSKRKYQVNDKLLEEAEISRELQDNVPMEEILISNDKKLLITIPKEKALKTGNNNDLKVYYWGEIWSLFFHYRYSKKIEDECRVIIQSFYKVKVYETKVQDGNPKKFTEKIECFQSQGENQGEEDKKIKIEKCPWGEEKMQEWILAAVSPSTSCIRLEVESQARPPRP